MAQSVDLILKGGTIVNQNGISLGDVAVKGGKVVAIGDVSGFMAAPQQLNLDTTQHIFHYLKAHPSLATHY